jgi:hypothetical protein
MDLELIQRKIYEIRSRRVMLDFDLAEMYGVETKRLKEAIRRNMERFEGDDFMFQLSKDEIAAFSRTQFATLNRSRGHNLKYAPFAFTELGVAMLSSVLNSKTAIEINRGIMRAFVAVRQLLSNPPAGEIKELQTEIREIKSYIERVFADYNDINEDTRMQLDLINRALAELQVNKQTENRPRRRVGFIPYE